MVRLAIVDLDTSSFPHATKKWHQARDIAHMCDLPPKGDINKPAVSM
jgi:hypothetical protein